MPSSTEDSSKLASIRKFVIGDGWLTADEIGRRTGLGEIASDLDAWHASGLLFAINHQNIMHFPFYALDPNAGYRPAIALQQAIKTLRPKSDWGLAIWFASANSFLGGGRPQDLLLERPERVVDAAEEEAAGVVHG